jgi:serine/threonine protein kinase
VLRYFKTPIWSRLVKAKSRSDDHRRLLEACMLELRVLTDEFIQRHENIANLLGVSWHGTGDNISPILIMELACEEHPTLKELLALDTPIKTRLEMVRDVLEGLSALHHIDVVHGDIKPENILIFKSSASAIGLSARLSDFGFCRPTADYRYGAGGTPYWNAPECLPGAPAELKKEEYGKPRDLYSLGLLAFHAITLHMPFGSATLDHISAMKLKDEVSPMLRERLQKPDSVGATVSPSHTPTKAHASVDIPPECRAHEIVKVTYGATRNQRNSAG